MLDEYIDVDSLAGHRRRLVLATDLLFAMKNWTLCQEHWEMSNDKSIRATVKSKTCQFGYPEYKA